MLILFDIDGTLLRSRGIGLRSMKEAVFAIHGVEVDPSKMDTGGRLDPHLFHELLSSHDLPSEPEHLNELSDAYVERMHHHFSRETWADALPGARTLVETVHEHDAMTASVLTGNIEQTCWLKLADAGFPQGWFEFGVFGDEGDTRRDLPAVGLNRYLNTIGDPLEPHKAIVIGDTANDVDCAKHNGCTVIAVATGKTSREELENAKPDLVLDSLEDTDSIMEWMLSR